jgi:hypothetical protein
MRKSSKVISILAVALVSASMLGYADTVNISAVSATQGTVDFISNVGTTVKYTGDVYTTSYGTGNPVKVSGTYTVSSIISDTSRKCRVQLKDTGWVMTNDISAYAISKDDKGTIVVVQNKYVSSSETTTTSTSNVSASVKVGDTLKYSGDAYFTSDGGKSVKVNGTYTVSAVKAGAKYNVQLKGIGWVSLESTTDTSSTSAATTTSTTSVKVGDTVKYSGDAYFTSDGGKSVKVNGTYTVSAVKAEAKYNVQLKGIGWVSLGSTTDKSSTSAATTTSTTSLKVGDTVKYSGDAYFTSDGGKSVKVNGTYTVSAVKAGAKYNVQLKGIGWVSSVNINL